MLEIIVGEKTEAKAIAAESITGFVSGISAGAYRSDTRGLSEASEIGYPLMLKAASGGGGRGMRVVDSEETTRELLGRRLFRSSSSL